MSGVKKSFDPKFSLHDTMTPEMRALENMVSMMIQHRMGSPSHYQQNPFTNLGGNIFEQLYTGDMAKSFLTPVEQPPSIFDRFRHPQFTTDPRLRYNDSDYNLNTPGYTNPPPGTRTGPTDGQRTTDGEGETQPPPTTTTPPPTVTDREGTDGHSYLDRFTITPPQPHVPDAVRQGATVMESLTGTGNDALDQAYRELIRTGAGTVYYQSSDGTNGVLHHPDFEAGLKDGRAQHAIWHAGRGWVNRDTGKLMPPKDLPPKKEEQTKASAPPAAKPHQETPPPTIAAAPPPPAPAGPANFQPPPPNIHEQPLPPSLNPHQHPNDMGHWNQGTRAQVPDRFSPPPEVINGPVPVPVPVMVNQMPLTGGGHSSIPNFQPAEPVHSGSRYMNANTSPYDGSRFNPDTFSLF